MKVEILDDGLMVVPETEFEEKILVKMFSSNTNPEGYRAFIKTGLTPADVMGLKISNED